MKHCHNRPLSFGCEAVILNSLSISRSTGKILKPLRKPPIDDGQNRPQFSPGLSEIFSPQEPLVAHWLLIACGGKLLHNRWHERSSTTD
jgi:hypothetical protein